MRCSHRLLEIGTDVCLRVLNGARGEQRASFPRRCRSVIIAHRDGGGRCPEVTEEPIAEAD